MIVVKPMPGESAFSHFARLAKLNLRPSLDQVLDGLRGKDKPRPSPRFLGDSSDLIAQACGMSHEAYLQRHSLVPIYRVLMGPRKPRWGRNWEFTVSRNDIHATNSFGKSVVRCPACETEDLDRYGIAYLHRDHYIPHIVTCTSHGLPLRRSSNLVINNWRIIKEKGFYEPSADILFDHESAVLCRYREVCVRVLASDALPSFKRMWAAVDRRIVDLGIESSLARRTGKVGEFMIKRLPSYSRIPDINKRGWFARNLRKMTYLRGYSAILLMCTLFDSSDDVLETIFGPNGTSQALAESISTQSNPSLSNECTSELVIKN